MNDDLVVDTPRGPITLRRERPEDAGFLETLFRHCALDVLELAAVAPAIKEQLVRTQLSSQTATYRTQYPDARFDIVERDGAPIGRLIVDRGTDCGCVVDIALMPEHRGSGLGRTIMKHVVGRFARDGRPVQCQVLRTNEASLRMCLAAGFVPVAGDWASVQLEWRPREPAVGAATQAASDHPETPARP